MLFLLLRGWVAMKGAVSSEWTQYGTLLTDLDRCSAQIDSSCCCCCCCTSAAPWPNISHFVFTVFGPNLYVSLPLPSRLRVRLPPLDRPGWRRRMPRSRHFTPTSPQDSVRQRNHRYRSRFPCYCCCCSCCCCFRC